MAWLCVTPACRFQTLLAEFGEESGACGKCDHCRGGPLAWPRRLGASVMGWRAATESRLMHFSAAAIEEPPADPVPAEAPIWELAPSAGPRLTVAEMRLLRALEAERAALARRRRCAARRIASDDALRALAQRRPNRADDPLMEAVAEPEAFLSVIARSIGES